jgi:hypothetical protein
MAASVDLCCELIREYLEDRLDDPTIVYAIKESPQIEINDRDKGTMLDNLNIIIVPMNYEVGDSLTRSEEFFVVRLGLIIAQRYALDQSIPFDAFIREKKEFVEKEIFFPIYEEEYFDNYEIISIVNLVASDADMAREYKVFYSELEITLRTIIS